MIKKRTHEIKEFISTSFPKWTSLLAANNPSPFAKRNVNFNYDGEPLYTSAIGKINDAGNPEGLWLYFNDNGRQAIEANYDADGERTGIWKWFDENHNLKEKSSYLKGKPQDSTALYYDNGQPKVLARHLNGELVSAGYFEHSEFAKQRRVDCLYPEWEKKSIVLDQNMPLVFHKMVSTLFSLQEGQIPKVVM